MLFLLASCDDRKSISTALKHPKKLVVHQLPIKSVEKITEKKPYKKTITIPAGYQLMSLNKIQTNEIGTVDHPTINGGLINENESETAVNYEYEHHETHIIQTHNNKSFEDNWVHSSQIHSVLNKAIHEGKLEYILRKSQHRGLPDAVSILPFVESQYQNNVVSNKGAAGAWQIMPSLASDYHLALNERFDFKKATDVALDYLQQLHKQFGNWELAFAAYNAGPKRVANALQKNPHATTISELALPSETKLYVTKIKMINQSLSNIETGYAS